MLVTTELIVLTTQYTALDLGLGQDTHLTFFGLEKHLLANVLQKDR